MSLCRLRSLLLEESCIKRNKNLNSKVKIKIFNEKENKKLNLTICRASRSNVRFLYNFGGWQTVRAKTKPNCVENIR